MKKKQETEQVSNWPEKIVYRGNLEGFRQLRSQILDSKKDLPDLSLLSEYQNFLYKRAMFGLSVYQKEEIKEMRADKRKRIQKVHRRTQTVLNTWKQEIIINRTNVVFRKLFPKSSITHSLHQNFSEADPKYVNNMTFKSLRITKDQIVRKLIEEKILPINFFDLKSQSSPTQLMKEKELPLDKL